MRESKEKILKSLEPLFKKAESEGLWFNSNYQDMWYTPKELREKQSQGFYIWGIDNWTLRNPQDRIDILEMCIKDLETEKFHFIERIKENNND